MDKIATLLHEARIQADENRSKDFRHFASSVVDCVEDLRQQLAAALAACEVKDDALEKLIEHTLSCEYRLDEFHGLGNDSGSGCSIELCNASSALSIQPDASALKAHDDALIERCAGLINKLEGPNATRSPETTTTACSTPST